jgi:tetratricopeptide (TPR) repeat protein
MDTSAVVQLVEETRDGLNWGRQEKWLVSVDDSFGIIQAAFEQSVTDGQTDAALVIGAGLEEYWPLRSKLSVGCDWLTRALGMDGGTTKHRADALHARGQLEVYRGNYLDSIYSSYNKALELYKDLDHTEHVIDSMCDLGFAACWCSSWTEALASLEDARARAQAAGYVVGEARALGNLGMTTYDWHLDYEGAMTLYEQGVAILRGTDEREALARILQQQGMTAIEHGDSEQAVACLEESVKLFESLGRTSSQALATIFLGDAEYQRGNSDLERHSRACFEQSIALASGMGDARGEGLALLYLGRFLCLAGETDEALPIIERSCHLLRLGEDAFSLARALLDLGRMLVAKYRVPEARECFKESALLFHRLGDISAVHWAEYELERCTPNLPTVWTDETLGDIMSTDFQVVPELEMIGAVFGGFNSSDPIVIEDQKGHPVGFLPPDWFLESESDDESETDNRTFLDCKDAWSIPVITTPDVQVKEALKAADSDPSFEGFVVMEGNQVVGIVTSADF